MRNQRFPDEFKFGKPSPAMSLTKEQQKELKKLSEELNKIEQFAIENNIDLDVFISEYNEEGYSVYATEKVSLGSKSSERKQVFERGGKEKATRTAQKAR